MTGCCVPLCTGSSAKGQRVFRFPRDVERRKKWGAQVKRDNWAPTDTTKICELHFEQDQFELNRQDGRRLLKWNALPTLFDYRHYTRLSFAHQFYNYYFFIFAARPSHRKPPCQRTLPTTLVVDAPQSSPAAEGDCDSSESDNTEQNKNVRQSTDVFSLQPSELIKKLQDLQKKNTALNFQLLHCKKKLKKQTKCSKRLQENVSALTSNLKFLNEDQKSALHKRSRKGCVWSAETVKKALQLKFACGSTGYDVLLEQGNPLPSRRTLCRRLQHLSFQPGVLKEIFDIMETKVAAMTDIEKDCVLFMDEMEIRKGLELDRGSDAFLGTTTLPESDQPANHALVFMTNVNLSDSQSLRNGILHRLSTEICLRVCQDFLC
ncbi:uncharacterized protein LOC125945789 [Dermacentor silvarum]|uniref:uncharacterized protein LOC125945789 n=1 Tax=Dermacentor silvarum TaxID=543639 RepID=UPI00210125FD|nr:uncharacterized protein LOC125945789 [Dermacentor silvarum]